MNNKLGFIKSVQDGSQNNSQRCIKKCAWTSAKNIWIFWDRIITGDETWVHHYESESKRQSMEWKHPQSSWKKKVQNPTIRRKTDAYNILGLTRPSSGTVSGGGTPRNSALYSEMFTDRLRPEIRSKRRRLLSKGVVLLHDNSRSHTAAHTANTLRKLKFEVMAHPPYSPDLAPSDYHLFGPLKEVLRGRRFTSDQEVKEVVHSWLAAQLKTFSEGIRKLVTDM